MKAVFCFEVVLDGETVYTATKMRDGEGEVVTLPEDVDYDEAHKEMTEHVKETLQASSVKPITCNEYLAQTED